MRVFRVFNHWCSGRKVGLYVFEQVAAVAAFLLAAWGVASAGATGRLGWLGGLGLGCALAIQGSLYFADLYDLRVAAEDRSAGTRLLRSLGIAVVVSAVIALIAPEITSGAVYAGVAGAVAAVLATRAALPAIVGKPERVLIVGDGARGRDLAKAVDISGEYMVVGLLPMTGRELAGPRDVAADVDAVAEARAADVVVVAADSENEATPAEALLRCRLAGLPVLDATAFAERALRRLPVSYLKASELIYSEGFRAGRLDAFFKRLLDLSAAAVLALVAAPIMLAAALAVRLDSPGPVFYSQERVGRGGRRFLLTKFRTMRTDAELEGRPVWARQDDDRITRVGRILRKSRMDELPQILAVLRGDMSFVGPRPERPFFVEQIKEQVPFYGLREAVKPGITGWAQIRYPYGASIEDARAKLEFDLYYMKNRSTFLDLSIIFHTVRHVLGGRGAR